MLEWKSDAESLLDGKLSGGGGGRMVVEDDEEERQADNQWGKKETGGQRVGN